MVSPIDSHRYPKSKLEIRWDGTVWVDESPYLIRHSGEWKIEGPGEDLVSPGDIGVASVSLWNDGRFSWMKSGTLSPYIGGPTGMYGIWARISVGLGTSPNSDPTEWTPVFTGVIYDWVESPSDHTVSLELRDPGLLYVQKRTSTVVLVSKRIDQFVDYLGSLAGIVDKLVDPSPITLQYCWLDDEGILGEIWEVARAEGARCYFDRGGTFHYEHPSHWALPDHSGSPVWSLDEDDFVEIIPELSVDSLVSQVRVEVQPRAVSTEQTLYELDETRVIPPGGTIVMDLRMSHPALSLGTLSPDGSYEILSSGGEDLSGTCVVSLEPFAQRARLQIVNQGTVEQAYLTALRLSGVPLIGGPTIEVIEEAPGTPPFDRVRGIGGNPYIQDVEMARMLAQMLRDRGSALHPLYRVRGVPGIPTLSLGDRIRLQCQDLFDSPREGFVTEIRWDAQEAFTQDVTILDAETLFPYSDYFIVGTTALGTYGRCWY